MCKKLNQKINRHFNIYDPLLISNAKVIEHFIVNRMHHKIALNKQKQEHDILATISESKYQESWRVLQEPLVCKKKLESKLITDMVVTETIPIRH